MSIQQEPTESNNCILNTQPSSKKSVKLPSKHKRGFRSKSLTTLKPSKQMQTLEKGWITNFHLLYSVNNERFPKSQRDLFEFPIIITPAGHKM